MVCGSFDLNDRKDKKVLEIVWSTALPQNTYKQQQLSNTHQNYFKIQQKRSNNMTYVTKYQSITI